MFVEQLFADNLKFQFQINLIYLNKNTLYDFITSKQIDCLATPLKHKNDIKQQFN